MFIVISPEGIIPMYKYIIYPIFFLTITFLGGCGGSKEAYDKSIKFPETTPTTPETPTTPTLPIISGIPKTTTNIYDRYQFLPSVSYTSSSKLSYSIQNKPAWATFDQETGLLEGIPPMGSEARYDDIILSVSDGSQSVTLAPFSIVVDAAVNLAHKFGVATQSSDESYHYYHKPLDAIDDNLSTFNMTADEGWLQVALPKGTEVSKVVIRNRLEWSSRLSGTKVYVGVKAYDGTVVASDYVGTLTSATEVQTFTFETLKKGDYILLKEDDDNLHVLEVEVYGVTPATPIFTEHESHYLISGTTSVGTTIATIESVDFQNDTLHYSIVGEVPFSIDAEGNIKVSGMLNAPSYTFYLQSSDGVHVISTPIMIDVTVENVIQEVLSSADVIHTSVTEEELIQATLEEIEVSKRFLLDAKVKIFNLNADASAKADGSSLSDISWNPTHDASLIISTFGKNSPLLYTNAVADTSKTIYKKEIAIIGEKSKARYMVMGANPLRVLGNAQMEQVMENSLAWLSARDDLKSTPFSVVIAHLDDSYYFRDESKTREWLEEHYGTQVSYNEEDACDGVALQGCLDKKPDLLIISQNSKESDDVEVVASSVNKALQDGVSVLYIHHDGNEKELGKALFTSVFDVTYEWDNYWKKLTLEGYDPTADLNILTQDLKYVKTMFRHFRDSDYAFDWNQCEDSDGVQNADEDKCHNVSGLLNEFEEGALVVKGMLDNLDTSKKDIFKEEGYRLQKLLALTSDKFRQSILYPMDKVTTDDNAFLKSYYADHAVYNYRKINPVQTDMGNFSRSDFSHITPIIKTVSLISKKKFRSTGAYAIAGKTVKVTRIDNSDVRVKVFINTLRSGATHQYEKRGYLRPKYLQTPHIEIKSGESIELTSPYGGTLQLEFDTNDLPVELMFENVGEHAHWAGEEDDDTFSQKLEADEFDWAEVVTSGFEVHSTLEKMKESVADSKWGTAQILANATKRYMSNFPHLLAGFKGSGIDVVDEIHDFATANSLTIENLDLVKHMNADQAACGYGCSGNPYDAYWSFSPIGHGDVHELGHGLEKSRFRFEGWETHASTNPYAYYTKSKYNETTGDEPDCQNLPFKEVFEELQASVTEVNPSVYLQENLWGSSSWSQQFMVTLQAMMHTQKMGKLDNGWHLLARLHILEREISRADDDWEANRDSLGFSSYTLDEFKAMRKNDWMLVSLSFAAGLDFREYLSMMGIEYSTKASSQVGSFNYDKVPKKFFVSTPNGYCKTDSYGSFLDKQMLDVDGETLFLY